MATKTRAKPKPATNAKPKAAVSTDILTLEEAAEYLRVPSHSLQAEAATGRVPGRLIAGEWRFSKSALLAWLAQTERFRPGSKEAVLSVAGIWKDDPTVDAMMKDIEERRRKNTVAGE
jgi:excisionase family DNA binding protein